MSLRRHRNFLLGKFEPSQSYRMILQREVSKKAKGGLMEFRPIMELLPQELQKVFHENFFPALKPSNLTFYEFRYSEPLSPETPSNLSFHPTVYGVEHDPIEFNKNRKCHLGLISKIQKAQRKIKSKPHYEITWEQEG